MKVDLPLHSLSPPSVGAGPAGRVGRGKAPNLSLPVLNEGRDQGEIRQPKDNPGGQQRLEGEKVPAPVINGRQVGLEFTQDKATGRNVIKVYDRESGDLIRQIPPEEILAFLRQIATGKGALVSRRL